ncbi:GAF domain-containing protein [Persicobacter diffluens]|uniref:PAS domain-containing protein n=1 Tax=Persicobacter diffluens TaxID=981 RepID=A0AAN5ALH2_9BACT|nr:hypothetical protein PEDI_14200 [Persicobacter diffluens]
MNFSKLFKSEPNSNIGIHQQNSMMATKFCAALLILINLGLASLNYWNGGNLFWIPITHIFLLLLSLAFNLNQSYRTARSILIYSSIIFACIISCADTPAGAEPTLEMILYQVNIATIPFLLLSFRNPKDLLLAFGLSILALAGPLFFAGTFQPEGLIFGPVDTISRKITAGFFTLLLFAIILLMEYFAHLQRKSNEELVDNMDQKQKDLVKQSEEMEDYVSKIKEQKAIDEKRQWITQGVSAIDQLLRTNEKDDALQDQIIREIVNYAGAIQGGLYSVEGESEDLHLQLTACYAYNRKKYHEQKIEIGEGLVGQCYLEQETIYLTEVPENYISITSGLGEANPNCILIMPLKYNEEIVGVIELAAFQVMDEYHMEYLQKASHSVASYLINNKINARTQLLLEESQLATEQLRAQEEEMRQNMEELHATHEQITRMQDEQKEQHEKMVTEIQQHAKVFQKIFNVVPNKIFMKDDECRMIMVNEAVCKAHNCSEEDLLGKSDLDFFGEEIGRPMVEEEKEIMRTGAREYRQTEAVDLSGGKTKYLRTIKMPFFIDYLGITGLLGIQFDETEKYEFEDKIRQLEEELFKSKKMIK